MRCQERGRHHQDTRTVVGFVSRSYVETAAFRVGWRRESGRHWRCGLQEHGHHYKEQPGLCAVRTSRRPRSAWDGARVPRGMAPGERAASPFDHDDDDDAPLAARPPPPRAPRRPRPGRPVRGRHGQLLPDVARGARHERRQRHPHRPAVAALARRLWGPHDRDGEVYSLSRRPRISPNIGVSCSLGPCTESGHAPEFTYIEWGVQQHVAHSHAANRRGRPI